MIWNDREGGHYVCRILDVKTRKRRTLPAPIYALSPDAQWALAPDFRRLHDRRPGYGYAGMPDPNADVQAPANAGIWRLDLRTGKSTLVLPFSAAAKFPYPRGSWTGAKPLVQPPAVFPRRRPLHLPAPLGHPPAQWHRRRSPPACSPPAPTAAISTCSTPMATPRTSSGATRTHILAWAFHPSHGNKFYLYQDKTDRVEVVGPEVMTVNGHCTYLPGNRWILNDTYPDKQREQHPYLYDVASGKRVPLGHFRLPPEYTGEWRCDTHPRFSPDGRKVVIDSPHGGNGRQLYLIDIAALVA